MIKKTIDCLVDHLNSRPESTPIDFWTKSVNSSAAWTSETTEKNCLGQMVEIGKYKAVPPEADVAFGTGRWFPPRKISAKMSYFIDINVYKYYQETNSLSGVSTQYGGSGKPL